MKLTTKKLATALAVVGASLCGAAQANTIPMTWSDYIDFTPDRLVTQRAPAVYTHTLDTFNVGTDLATSYTLTFNIFDDQSNDGSEKAALFQVTDLLGPTGTWTSFGGTESDGWTILGLIQINLFGELDVKISSVKTPSGAVGDFYLGWSRLDASGIREVKGGGNSVPEPGTLALFGAGLLGFGLMRRKRNAA